MAGEPAFIRSIVWLVFFTGLLNFIPDYISLLETRWLLRRGAGRWKTRNILLADALFTAGISFLLIRLSLGLVYGSGVVLLPAGDNSAQEMAVSVREVDFGSEADQLLDMVTFSEDYGKVTFALQASSENTFGEVPIPVSIFFYSAFVTSAWLWLFALATIVIQGLVFLGERARPLVRAFGYEHTPFRAVGYASIVVVTLFFIAGLPLVIL